MVGWFYLVVVRLKMKKTDDVLCPRCKVDWFNKDAGLTYPTYPALSRRDNKTLICSGCGVEEAMNDWIREMKRNKSKVLKEK